MKIEWKALLVFVLGLISVLLIINPLVWVVIAVFRSFSYVSIAITFLSAVVGLWGVEFCSDFFDNDGDESWN